MNPVNPGRLGNAIAQELKEIERDMAVAKKVAAAKGEALDISAFAYNDSSTFLDARSVQHIPTKVVKPVVQPVAKPVVPAKPVVLPAAQLAKPAAKPADKPAKCGAKHVAKPVVHPAVQPAALQNFSPVENSPFKEFYFKRRGGGKLYFYATFQPKDQAARVQLEEHGLRVHENKEVMEKGKYYTKNQKRQLALLELVRKLCAIAHQLEGIKQTIRQG